MTRAAVRLVRPLALFTWFALVGCQGQVLAPASGVGSASDPAVVGAGGSGTSHSGTLPDGSSDPVTSDVQAIMASAECVGSTSGVRAPLRALTPVQFERSVQALFEGKVAVPSGYPALLGAPLTGFGTDSALNTLSGGFAEALSGVAEQVALSVMEGLPGLLPCAAQRDRACASEFVRTYAPRAFRRPLPADEESALLAAYDGAMASHGDFVAAIGELTATILQHPLFVYMPEIGQGSGRQRKLDGYEVATRLSYLLWNAPPDPELLRAAAAGELAQQDAVLAQGQRMLADPRFDDVLHTFTREWLGVTDLSADAKDASLFPAFDAGLASSIGGELDRFVSAAFAAGAGGFSRLMAGRETQVDARMHALYGAPGAAPSAGWAEVTLGEERAGLLTRAALLAHFAGPVEPSHVRRGKVVRVSLLCDPMPAPPPGATTMQPSYPLEADTRRERSEILQNSSACGACHKRMDPIGLAFDDFDALGRHLGGTIDVSGDVQGTDEAGGPFSGSRELAARLADSAQAMQCLGRQWFRYAFGRMEEVADACTFARIAVDLERSGGDLRAMLASALITPGFTTRVTEGS